MRNGRKAPLDLRNRRFERHLYDLSELFPSRVTGLTCILPDSLDRSVDVAVFRDDGSGARKVYFLHSTRAELAHVEIVPISVWSGRIVAIPSRLHREHPVNLNSFMLTTGQVKPPASPSSSSPLSDDFLPFSSCLHCCVFF